jgi:hypothetical protein
VLKIRGLARSRAVSLEGRPATEPRVNAPLIVIGGESIQLAMQVEAVPEEGLVEILAPKGSDQPLDERMRARDEGNRLEFLDVEDAQIRPPAMKPEQWVMICTEALGKWLSAPGLVEHAADAVSGGFVRSEETAPLVASRTSAYPTTLRDHAVC